MRTGGRQIDDGGPLLALGSPAQVWLERAERAVRQLHRQLAEQVGWSAVTSDADAVLFDLRQSATQVAELNRELSTVDTSRLAAERDRLAGQSAETDDTALRTELIAAHRAIEGRLGVFARRTATRDALLARMRAAVHGLEQASDEVTELLSSARPELPATAPTVELTERLTGLRLALTELTESAAPAEENGQNRRDQVREPVESAGNTPNAGQPAEPEHPGPP
jgi:hypothetical protein